MQEAGDSLQRAWTQAMTRTWREKDENFRRRLVSDPKGVLKDLGAKIPENVSIRVVENSTDELIFVLPPPPAALKELKDRNVGELYSACPGTVCAVAPDDM